MARERRTLAAAFLGAARCYWLCVFPRVRLEVRRWRRQAGEIPDPVLRRLALATHQAKWGNIEGAAAFAAFLPRARRAIAVRALVAFQAAYDYADTLSERPTANPQANGCQLHLALLVALEPGVPHPDYYAHHPSREDNGYLRDLVDVCRVAFAALPSHAVVAESARRAAKRIVSYQSLNYPGQQSRQRLERWADSQTPPGSGMFWWETAAAGASSLAVLALIAAGARSNLDRRDVTAIEHAYFPWISALHTLLDSLIDYREDTAAGQPSLIAPYGAPAAVATHMQRLAEQSVRHAQGLPAGSGHLLLLAGMSSLYLSAPEASQPHALPTTVRVLNAMGGLATPTMLILHARRGLSRLRRPTSLLRHRSLHDLAQDVNSGKTTSDKTT
jgi:tetraprenyl-beta-curcumene synthase